MVKCLVLKNKAMQLLEVFLKLVENKFLFCRFSDLQNSVKCIDSMFPCYSFYKALK